MIQAVLEKMEHEYYHSTLDYLELEVQPDLSLLHNWFFNIIKKSNI